jgi:MAF protein
MNAFKVVLASNSPRRKQLLSLLDWPFQVIPADIDESQRPGEPPAVYVRRLACEKAQAVAAHQAGLVIAADTIVVDQDELLGKPADVDEAFRMLSQLRGRTHQVYTGLALLNTSAEESCEALCRTDVPMRHYADAEIQAYVDTGDPFDKAGAYAIQHQGFNPVQHLEGCFASVMGLPLCHLMRCLKPLGLEAPSDLPQRCQKALDYDCPIFTTILGRL